MNDFDITKHEFADTISEITVEPLLQEETIVLNLNKQWIFFDKGDVVAMAKHFKLTTDDLTTRIK